MSDQSRAKKVSLAVAIAAAVAIPAEGLRQTWYSDPPGVITVCYGSTKNVDKLHTYTIEECKARLDADMLSAVETVEKCQPGLPINVLAAFGDAVYNMGPKIACDKSASTAARRLASKDFQAACDELTKWDKARVAGTLVSLPGLTKRRAKEREICLTP